MGVHDVPADDYDVRIEHADCGRQDVAQRRAAAVTIRTASGSPARTSLTTSRVVEGSWTSRRRSRTMARPLATAARQPRAPQLLPVNLRAGRIARSISMPGCCGTGTVTQPFHPGACIVRTGQSGYRRSDPVTSTGPYVSRRPSGIVRRFPEVQDHLQQIRRWAVYEATGLDNSPAWDQPLAAVPADNSLFKTYTRRDVAHAGAGQRPTNDDYARYIRLTLMYRDHGWRYWRGPTWLNTTWLVARGLQVHGYQELARLMDDDLVDLVAKSGFREYFHPRTGRGHGTRSFSWSAALLIHTLMASE